MYCRMTSTICTLLPFFDYDLFDGRYGEGAQPPNVLFLAVREFEKKDDMEDSEWRENFLKLANERQSVINERGVRRVTFFLCRKGHYPMYFTLRDFSGVWKEE